MEKQILRVWAKAGFKEQPKIIAPALTKRLKITPLNTVSFAVADGANYKGMTVASVFESDEAVTEGQIKKAFELGPPEITQTLSEYAESPCIIVEGTPISRIEVIKYVANKLGGSHYDTNREKEYQRLLDHVGQTYKIAEKNGVYFELLSMGQRLVSSPDIQELHGRLKSLQNRNP